MVQEPDVIFDGGTKQDRIELIALFEEFWAANDIFASHQIERSWSHSPDRVHFNSNGYTYYGLSDWLGIWDYYRPRFKSTSPGKRGDTRVIVRNDMALVADAEVERSWEWMGEGEAPTLLANPRVRATMVYVKEGGEWKMVHAHYSSAASGPRPDQTA